MAGQSSEALSVSERLVRQFVSDVSLWSRRVALVTSLIDDTATVLRCIRAAVDACINCKVRSAVCCVIPLLSTVLL